MRMWERTVGEKTEGMGGHRKSLVLKFRGSLSLEMGCGNHHGVG